MEDSEVTGLFTCWGTYALALVIVLLVCIYERRTYSIFSSVGVPGPRPLPVIGNMWDIYKLGVGGAEIKWTKEYGKVFGQYYGRVALTHVGDVDILKDVLVKNSAHFVNRATLDLDPPMSNGLFFLNGSAWHRIRNIITPAFSSGKLKLMVNDINICSKILTNKLLQASGKSHENIKIRDEYFGPFTMDVVARTVFGVEVEAQTNPDDPFVKMAKKAFEKDAFTHPAFLIVIVFPRLAFLLKYFKLQYWPRDSVNFFCSIARKIIEERKKETVRRNDLMQFLIEAERTGRGDTDAQVSDDKKIQMKQMTTEEIVGQAFIFFVAGYDTTAGLLQYTAYLLATHSDVQERLYNEIRTSLGNEDITYDDVMQLQYLDQVICESLRLYPPAPRMNRVGDSTVVVNGITIRKDAGMSIPIYSIHHDPDYYPEPDKFDPERFRPENKAKLHPCQFIPFGHGQRTCVGMRLALLEAKIALVHVMRKCQFHPCSETEIPLKVRADTVTKPLKPIKLLIEARD